MRKNRDWPTIITIIRLRSVLRRKDNKLCFDTTRVIAGLYFSTQVLPYNWHPPAHAKCLWGYADDWAKLVALVLVDIYHF